MIGLKCKTCFRWNLWRYFCTQVEVIVSKQCLHVNFEVGVCYDAINLLRCRSNSL